MTEDTPHDMANNLNEPNPGERPTVCSPVEMSAWTVPPHCSHCGRELELKVEFQGLHDASSEYQLCHGALSLVFCTGCGHVIRSLFDPYHLSCNLNKHAYAPTQLMV